MIVFVLNVQTSQAYIPTNTNVSETLKTSFQNVFFNKCWTLEHKISQDKVRIQLHILYDFFNKALL